MLNFRQHGHLAVALFITVTLSAQQGRNTSTIGPAPAQIAPPRPNYPFPDGRSYVYAAEWHLITAGTGSVRMEVSGNDRKVTAPAESTGAVNVLFPVHDHFESHFDPRTFCSLSIVKHSEEGSHQRETSIRFDYARKKSTLDEKNLKTGETKHVENDLAGCATDVITGFYYLQSLPLQMGESYEFPISDGKTTMVRGFLRARGVAGPVRSPTYTLIEPHAVGAEVFVHVDLYRLNAPSEIDDLALGDYLAARHVLLIEWPEKGAGRLPAADLELTLSYAGAGRELLMQSHGELGRRWLTNLATDTSLIPYLSNIT